jgi:hypothetical protein
MHKNDPTKDEVYIHRCPLFGDITCIRNLIGGCRDIEYISKFGYRSDLGGCLKIIDEARGFLIYPFLKNNPSSLNFCLYDSACFNGEPSPDPETVEKRTGYPAALLKSLRLIYWRTPSIESLCSEANDINDLRAIRIDKDKAVEEAKNTSGVEPTVKKLIDSKIVFMLFALKKAMMAIYTDVVWNKSIRERKPSQEYYKKALIYLEYAKSEHLIKEGKKRIKQLHAPKKKRNKALLKYCNELMQEKPSPSAASLWLRIQKENNPKVIDGTKIYRAEIEDTGEEKIFCISPTKIKPHKVSTRAFSDYYAEIKK